MYSSMEIVVLAAKRQVKGSTDGEQGRFNDGADGGELAELRTTAAEPERTVGPDGFRASSIASDLNCGWTFSAEDAAGSSVLGRQYRDSVSVVVENEAQSASCFGCGKANAADCPGLAAKRVSLRPRSNAVLVCGKHGGGMGCFGICRCRRITSAVLLFIRQESGAESAIRQGNWHGGVPSHLTVSKSIGFLRLSHYELVRQ